MELSFQTLTISLITTFSLLFFLTTPFYPFSKPHQQRSLLSQSPCSTFPFFNGGFLNYLSLHNCTFNSNPFLSLPFLSLTLLLHFYILIKTAQSHFSLIVTKLSSLLSLNSSMAAVTLLALGNGAPDVFASIAAVSGGNSRTGFGAILSAGTFVSGFVVGIVGINSGPFCVDSSSFVRDVMFYLIAGLMMFYVYLSGELYFWQSVGFVGFYLLFVGFVFWMDFGSVSGKIGGFEKEEEENVELLDCEKGEYQSVGSKSLGVFEAFKKISTIWETPVSLLLKLTIPQTSPNEWSRFYQSTNIALCPLALLYSCNQFIPLNHPIIFLIPKTPLPLWLVVLFSSSSLAILHYIIEKEPPKTEQIHVVLLAFIMSVFWISNIAGELLNCLSALGKILNLPPAILGLTVLAWGNSVGDLVADVALAKAGQPALAMAGCFAGPMFNMLVGLGMGLVIETAKVYPEPYVLNFHISIVVAFVFLFLSLMGSLLVITWSRFRVPRFWGFCLVGLYVVFIFISLVIAKFSS